MEEISFETEHTETTSIMTRIIPIISNSMFLARKVAGCVRVLCVFVCFVGFFSGVYTDVGNN